MTAERSSIYDYWAFLSYCREDSAVVEKLHAAIEGMEIPVAVRGQLVGEVGGDGEPLKLHPVFRDIDELEASAELSEQLRGKLERSRHLVLMCSRAAARSEWVNKEVEYFRSLGRGGRVLVVIVDGEPGVSAVRGRESEECLPPVLVEAGVEPNWVDLRRGGEGMRRGVLRLAAGMMGVNLDVLVERERRRRIRKAVTGVVAGVGVATVVCVLAWDLWVRPVVGHYMEESRIWGEPVGEGVVSAGEVKHRHRTVRLTKRGRLGRVVLLEKIDGLGRPRPSSGGAAFFDRAQRDRLQRVCVTHFEYGESGELLRERNLNYEGQELFRVRYERDAEKPELVRGAITATSGFSMEAPSGAAYVERVYSENGKVSRERYLGGDGEPVEEENGGFGKLHETVDERVLWVSLLDRNGDVLHAEGKKTVFRFEESDREGLMVALKYFDGRRNAFEDRGGVHEIRYEHDEFGNRVMERYYDLGGEVEEDVNGVAAVQTLYGGWGEELGKNYLGADGHAAMHSESGVFGVRYGYDDDGRIERFTYVDGEGAPMVGRRGYAGYGVVFDPVELEEVITFFDADEKPQNEERRKYDQRAMLIERRFFDEEGKARIGKGSEEVNGREVKFRYSGFRYYYNELGAREWQDYLDAWGEVIEIPGRKRGG